MKQIVVGKLYHFVRTDILTFVVMTRIHGPTYENGSWRIKINQEIYNKSPDIVTVIKVHRLK
jgi:hypothetical protein